MLLMTLRLFCIVLLSLYSAYSSAMFKDGNDIYRICTTPKDDKYFHMDASYCQGYIIGVVDTVDGFFACLPEGVTVGQNVDIVTKYLATHPEIRHMEGSIIVTDALKEFFPCKKRE
ncbi:Rap1a/Tai family immunity protein [Aeromonas allosaccharophila]